MKVKNIENAIKFKDGYKSKVFNNLSKTKNFIKWVKEEQISKLIATYQYANGADTSN